MKKSLPQRPPAFSLVVSLIILTLLSVLVASFLSTTALDRTTGRAFLGKSQAEVAADTAVKEAISLLREHLTEYPDSSTYWESLDAPAVGGTVPVEGTMLYFRDQPPPNGYTGSTATSTPKRYVLPLMSRGVDANGRLLGAVPVESKRTAMGTATWSETTSTSPSPDGSTVFVDSTSVDLNQARFNGDTAGWIGSPAPAPGETLASPRGYRAHWVELKENGDPKGRTIGRYAFWMEDESFKLNLNQLGSTKGGRGNEWTETAQLNAPANPSATPAPAQRPLPAQLAALTPLQGMLRSAPAPSGTDLEGTAASIATLRDGFLGKKVPDLRSFNQVDIAGTSTNGGPYRLADDAKFLTTAYSAALNLSRQGSQRLNLNGVGFDKRWDDPSVKDSELQKGIDQVVATVRYHAPKFSQRFYRLSSSSSPAVLNDENMVLPKYRDIYLYKLAANIRDFIDPDLQPTIIVDPGKIGLRSKPITAPPDSEGPGTNEIWAQGKDSAPFLQEAVARYRTKVTGSKWELWVDYYMEFWNMTNRDVSAADLGPNPVMRISNQLAWRASTGGGSLLSATSSIPGGDGSPVEDGGRAVVVDLINNKNSSGTTVVDPVIFKAGACTVITTDPDFASRTSGTTSPAFSGGLNLSNLSYRAIQVGPKSNRYYTGTLKTGETGIKPDFRNGGEDYITEVMLANDMGFLEFHASPIAHGGGPKPTSSGPMHDDWYGGTLLGNGTTPSQLSDPRTNNEQIVYTRFISGASTKEPDQARYWNTVGSPRFSLGYPNALYANPQNNNPWPDYYRGWNATPVDTAQNPTADTAPAQAFNGIVTKPDGTLLSPPKTVLGLLSVGQLGDVFDPARVKGSVGTLGIEGARGGGRTYRIGQHDDRVDVTTPNAASLAWASWRLADFFSVSNEIQLPGVININGLMRDCVRDQAGKPVTDAAGRMVGAGAALRAACYGMKLYSVSRPNSSGTTTPAVAEKDLNSTEPARNATLAAGLQNVIQQAIQRMTQNDPGGTSYTSSKPYFGPFSERGEISELDAFSTGSNLLTGVKMEESFDHSREELVRRIMELITTRGSVFSVYAIGQAITEGPAPRKQRTITGTHRVKVTFQFVPKQKDGSDFRVTKEEFDPASVDAVNKRFAPPDHYDVQILQVST